MAEDFLTLPAYIWKGIFSVLKVLGAGLLLGIFAAKYQKRKEIELQVKADVLKLQLETYVKLNALVSRIRTIIAPPLIKEAYFQKIIDTESLNIKYMEYSSFFDSIEAFDNYYKGLVTFHHSEHIYMQYAVEQKLSEFIGYMTELKMALDAFCDTENSSIQIDRNISEDHIQTSCQLTGICVQNDMTRFYCEMDQLLAYEISHISLEYRSHYMKSAKERILRHIASVLEKYIYEESAKGKLAHWFYFKILFRSYGNSTLLTKMPIIIVHWAYVHNSHKYTPEEWYNLPDDEAQEMIEEFYSIYVSNQHHG